MLDKERLVNVLNTTRRFLNDNPGVSESDIENHVGRILDYLGWDILDPKEVKKQFQIEAIGTGTWRADFALFSSPTKKDCLIEVKKLGEDLRQHEEQLLRYANAAPFETAILTNGRLWWFYLPQELGLNWQERKFAILDLTEDSIEAVMEKFADYLSKDKTGSGEAIKLAKVRVKTNRVKGLLPEVWQELLAERNEAIVSLISEATERKQGVRPDEDDVKEFLLSLNKPTLPPITYRSESRRLTPVKRREPDGEYGFTKGWGAVEFIGLDGIKRDFNSPLAFAQAEKLKYLGMRHALDCALRPKEPSTAADLERQYIVTVGNVTLNKDMTKDEWQHLKNRGKVTIRRIR